MNIDGTLSNIVAESAFGYGMEAESIRIIQKSPNWKLATIAGHPVVAYKRQPITFVVLGN